MIELAEVPLGFWPKDFGFLRILTFDGYSYINTSAVLQTRLTFEDFKVTWISPAMKHSLREPVKDWWHHFFSRKYGWFCDQKTKTSKQTFVNDWCNSLNGGPKVDQKGWTFFEKVDLVKRNGKCDILCCRNARPISFDSIMGSERRYSRGKQ